MEDAFQDRMRFLKISDQQKAREYLSNTTTIGDNFKITQPNYIWK